jgi:hypothetical protein
MVEVVVTDGAHPRLDPKSSGGEMKEYYVWTTAVALGGLILGIVNFTWAVARPWWESRPARLSARSELYSPSWRAGSLEDRVIIDNAGPATAHDLTVRVYADDGADITDQVDNLWPPMPIPVLHPGQALHLKSSASIAVRPPRRAALGWRDKRGSQAQDFWLSYHER